MDINEVLRNLPPTQAGYLETKFNMTERDYTRHYADEIADNYVLDVLGCGVARATFEVQGLAVKILINKNRQNQHDSEVKILQYLNELEYNHVPKMYYSDCSRIILEKVRTLTEEEYEEYGEELDEIELELQELGVYIVDTDGADQWGIRNDGSLVLLDLGNGGINKSN